MRMSSGLRVLWTAVLVVGLGEAATAQEKAASGKELFTKYKCTMCHSVKAEGIEAKKAAEGGEEAKGTDLSDVGAKVQSAQWIQDYLLKKVDKDGKKHKTVFKGTEEELKTLAEWLFSLKGKK
ncbi:MAG: cytochrome c [Acidobacteria bacterium]|nr:cytochrome c [Acidobacteriota bacterium]MDW7983127.1 c-type cytochrome [Acidobacteriota bacterium]